MGEYFTLRQLTQRYVVALALFAVLSITANVLIQQRIDLNSLEIELRNTAAKQRMWSQRIAKLALQVVALNDSSRVLMLSSSVDSMRAAHKVLLTHGGTETTTSLPEVLHDLYFGEQHHVAQQIQNFINHADSLLSSLPNQATIENPHFVYIITRSNRDFLEALDLVVAEYQKLEFQRSSDTSTLNLVVLLATLSSIIGLSIFFFRPLSKKVVAQLEELENSREEVRKNQLNLDAIVNATPDGIFSLDAEGRCLVANKVVKEYYSRVMGRELKPGDIYLGADYIEKESQQAYDFISGILSLALEGKGQEVLRERHGKIYLQISKPFYDGDKAVGVVLYNADVTEREQLLEQVKHSEANLRAIMESSQSGIISVDSSLRIVTINTWMKDRVLNWFGIELYEGLSPEDVDYISNMNKLIVIQHKALKGERFVTEWSTTTIGGEKITLELRASPIFVPDSDSRGAVILVTDVTDRKAVELELLHAKAAAESASKAKSVFLSSMSHELRTPLNSILGFSQILQRDHSLQPRQKGYVEMMYRSGNHLLDLITDILDLSKIEAGHLDLIDATYDLIELEQDLVAMFATKAEQKGLDLILHCYFSGARYISTDGRRLRQVLINLIGNAVKFTGRGSVSIDLSLIPNPEVPGASTFNAVVSDTGRGIPEDQLESIFKPFKQIEGGRSSEGSGLGLAISSRIIQLMHGTIGAQSKEGVGSIFTFELPVNMVEDVNEGYSLHVQEPVGIANGVSPLVLVVDDIYDNRTVARAYLEVAGFRCIEAENGEQAVEYCTRTVPDAIMMDLMMPVMDGRQAMNRVRSMQGCETIPIIAVTASGFQGKREQLMAEGFSEYIQKPIRGSQLYEALGTLLDLEYVYEVGDSKLAAEQAHDTQPYTPAEVKQAVSLLSDNLYLDFTDAVECQDFRELTRIIDLPELKEFRQTEFYSTLVEAIKANDFKLFIGLSHTFAALKG